MEASRPHSGVIYKEAPGYFRHLSVIDWLFGAALLGAALFALNRYAAHMDGYERVILLLTAPLSPYSAGTGSRCAG